MSLQRLDIFNVRNIFHQSITPSESFNFIYGKNGSGKSAFLEAIHFLGRAKSFRTSQHKQAISFHQNEMIVSAQSRCRNSQISQIGIRISSSDVNIHKNHQSDLKRSDLAIFFPLQLIHPKSFELLDAGSQFRREFLDWGVFNHDKTFLTNWKNYKKALSQRNALLKLQDFDQIPVWNNHIAYYGNLVDQSRKAYFEHFFDILQSTVKHFLPLVSLSFHLISGWNEEFDLSQNLLKDFDRDKRDGFTHSGPHRGDFHLMINGKLAKEVVSRGQLKLLIISLKLAQVQFFLQTNKHFGCILIDDFSAELDFENRAKILAFIQQMQCQSFITITERNELGDLGIIDKYKLFHVEHGVFTEVDVPRET